MGKTSWSVLGLLFVGWMAGAQDAQETQGQGMPTLTVATEFWPPFRMADEDGQIRGLDIDILHRLQAHSGIRFEVKRVPWGRALKQMQTGKTDLMIGLAHTPERAAYIDYLQPSYYQCHPAFYGKAQVAASLRDYRDLHGQKVGYVLSSAYFERFDNDGGLDKHGVLTEDQLLRMVERGHLPLMVGTDCQVDYALSQRNDTGLVKAAYRPAHTSALYLGMSKHSPHHELGPRLAKALQVMVESGEIEALAKPYRP